MAGAALDMSLDDLIKNNKKSGGGDGGGGRGSGRASGPGPVRRFNNRGAHRATPYGGPKAPDATWSHDMFGVADQRIGNGGPGGRSSAIETGTKLYISNLDYGVSNEDIKELFAEVGDLKKYSINYDKSARSKGTAEVVFSRRQDALAAIKRYNNVQLDGKPMKIEIVGVNLAAPPVGGIPFANNPIGNMNGYPRRWIKVVVSLTEYVRSKFIQVYTCMKQIHTNAAATTVMVLSLVLLSSSPTYSLLPPSTIDFVFDLINDPFFVLGVMVRLMSLSCIR